MNDPLSPLTVPPPRYLLESDSSDEEGQGSYSYSRRDRKSKITQPLGVALQWLDGTSGPFDTVLLGVGQVGSYLGRKLALSSKDSGAGMTLGITLGDVQMCRGWKFGGDLFIGVEDMEGTSAGVWEVARALSGIKASRW